jgi:F-type H+-transporting ATPase subunit b
MFKNIYYFFILLTSTLLMPIAAFAEEAAHEGGGGLPQFDPSSWPSQIFWLAIFFTVLYITFSKSVIPTLGGTIESRRAYIADNIQKAESLSRDAESLRLEVEKALKSAGQTAGQSIAAADLEAKDKLSSALSDFRARYETEIAATETRIEAATLTAMSDMEKIVASLASQAAQKIAGIPADESQAESIVKSLSQKSKLAA